MAIDTEALLADCDLAALIQGRGVKLHRSGREFRGPCPFHQGKSPEQFAVVPSKGFAHCFACGWSGDAIEFVKDFDGVDFREACSRIGSGLSGGSRKESEPPPPERLTKAPPDGEPPPDMTTRRWGEPVATWCYRTPSGVPLMYVARYEYDDPQDDGTVKRVKLTPQWTWGSRDGGQTWGWGCGHFQKPRPLYNLHLLVARPDAPVIIVEGEKCADAAARLLSAFVPVTWPGGAGAVGVVDWSPLAGRDVVVWPDADEAGVKASEAIQVLLSDTASRVRWLDVSDRPAKWDAADAVAEGWTPAETLLWCKAQVRSGQSESAVSAPKPASAPRPAAPPSAPAPAPSPKPARRLKLESGGAQPETSASRPAVEDVQEPGFISWTALGLKTNGNGAPYENEANVELVIRKHPMLAGKFWWDTFHRRLFTDWQGERQEIAERDTVGLLIWIQRHAGLQKVRESHVTHALLAVAMANARNEPRDWMDSLVWDMKPRLYRLLAHYFGAIDSAYHREVGRNFLRSMVARVYRPGCQVDYMPVFEGSTGTYKSTALGVLGGPWGASVDTPLGGKEFYEIIQGKILVDFSELHTLRGAALGRAKHAITNRSDRFRVSYGRRAEDHPRQCVFAGTTEDDDWLSDPRGNRRFWPVRCGHIRISDLQRDREQLFAEAVAEVKAGEKWYEVPKDETIAQQAERRAEDEWEWLIHRHSLQRRVEAPGGEWVWVDRQFPVTDMSVAEVMASVLEVPAAKWTRGDQMRVADAFKALKWVRFRAPGSVGGHRYYAPGCLPAGG